MKTIIINIKDDTKNIFLEKLLAMMKKENIPDDGIKIDGLSVKEYYKINRVRKEND